MSTTPDTEPLVLRSDDGGITTLTLNRPRQLNPLSSEMIDALGDELDRVAADPSVRVVILAGDGRAFSAGHDLRQMRTHPDRSYYDELFRRCAELMQSVTGLPQPVIATAPRHTARSACTSNRWVLISYLPEVDGGWGERPRRKRHQFITGG